MSPQRPPHVKAPFYLSENPPVPEPDPIDGRGREVEPESGGPKGKEPTRYGDWENKGICWDF